MDLVAVNAAGAETAAHVSCSPPGSNARPSEVESYLVACHQRDQNALSSLYVHSPELRHRFYLVNTVSPAEGVFVANYLNIPLENVLKVKTTGYRQGNRVNRDLQTTFSNFFNGREDECDSVTFLGHMEHDEEDRPRFAHLLPQVLFDLMSDLRLRSVNFVSCTSMEYSTQLAKLFAGAGRPLERMTCVADGVEVSPWPNRKFSEKNPVRMLYAGPELGEDVKKFSQELHFPMLDAVRVLRYPVVEQEKKP